MSDQQRELLNFFYQSFSSDIALLSDKNLDGSAISQVEPLIIYDLTGGPLFADFEIADPRGVKVGAVRSSALQKKLPLIDSILIGNQWFDAPSAIEKAKQAALAQNIGAIIDAKIVCYGYPRMGALVTCQTSTGPHSLLYDAAAGVLVKQWDGKYNPASEAGVPLPERPEGQPFYSILTEIPEAGPGVVTPSIHQWNRLESVFGKAKAGGFAPLKFSLESLGQAGVRFAVRGALLPAVLYSQITEVYCAVATAEMMLSFVGISKKQNDIAAAMNTGPSGTTNPDFLHGMTILSSGKVTGQFINLPGFADCVQVVEQMLPAKSGIPGHARLLRGWREYIFFDDSGTVLDKEQFLIINDPYPTTSGQLVLENFTKPIDSFYTNLISMQKVK